MPKKDSKILKYNHGEKSMKVPFITYADLQCLLKKMNTCHNNPKKSSTTMDSWDRLDETSLPDKEAFYSSLNMEDITDADHRHAKRVFKNLNNKNLGDYHDLHIQSDALLLADVFENFRNKCTEDAFENFRNKCIEI